MNRRQALVGALLGSVALRTMAQAEPPVVETRSGRVQGFLDGGVNAFLGIPYGDDTSDANRFNPPRPPKAWSGIRATTAYGNKAPQTGTVPPSRRPGRPAAWASFGSNQPESEDCLVLNVWTPAAGSGNRPVMFWIHGGGFFMGAGSEPRMNGRNLAQAEDVVVVTINHRLGALGYLYLAGLGDRYADMANIAQLDIIAALSWVRDNISAFGGDPHNVTVFGNSGGGSKISTLMAMPAAHGLFHKAIVQSGSYLQCRAPEASARATELLMSKLGLARGDVAGLRKAPAKAIVQAYWDLGRDNRDIAPVMDGRSIPSHPYSPEALQLFSDVPLLIGSTYTEASTLISDPTMFEITWDTLPARWQSNVASLGRQLSIEEARAQMDALRKAYPQESAPFVFFRGASDLWTIFAAIIIADRKAAMGSPTWCYELTYTTPVDGGKWGSPHGLDVPLIFLNTDKAPSIVPDDGPARRMARIMGATWTAFARNGRPDNASIPAWPRYDANRRPAMMLNESSSIVRDYRGADRRTLGELPRMVI